MNRLYESIGISKQSFHQKEDRWLNMKSEQSQLLLLIHQIREDHPTMGFRDMYYKLQPECMGRDAFEQFCKQENLGVSKVRNYRITTDSTGVIRFNNLLEGLEINKVNQVWQSDITYFEVQGKFYYITFIIDAYSRRIVGHQTSNRLKTKQTTLPALQKAIKLRESQNQEVSELIFHSDGGGQYYASKFLSLTKKNSFQNSMCEYAWQNGKAERINGVIKNNYLIHRDINSFEELVKEVDRSVRLYNSEKLHISLKRKTPIQFEKNYLRNGQRDDDEKSATKSNPRSKGYSSPSDWGQKDSESKIAPKSNVNNKIIKHETVNVI
jgi:transposase InsO family protein